ncbi:MAG TPA: hypothetical protein VK977_09905, partial [Actinomycetota bacterium]|nr:hypothetical protein [Actinomycetota bacterium]
MAARLWGFESPLAHLPTRSPVGRSDVVGRLSESSCEGRNAMSTAAGIIVLIGRILFAIDFGPEAGV